MISDNVKFTNSLETSDKFGYIYFRIRDTFVQLKLAREFAHEVSLLLWMRSHDTLSRKLVSVRRQYKLPRKLPQSNASVVRKLGLVD